MGGIGLPERRVDDGLFLMRMLGQCIFQLHQERRALGRLAVVGRLDPVEDGEDARLPPPKEKALRSLFDLPPSLPLDRDLLPLDCVFVAMTASLVETRPLNPRRAAAVPGGATGNAFNSTRYRNDPTSPGGPTLSRDGRNHRSGIGWGVDPDPENDPTTPYRDGPGITG